MVTTTRRADVGSRPVAVVVARDEKKSIYVANHLSDSISIIDYTLVSQHNNRATATTSERPAGAYASPRDLYREVDVASQEIPLGPPAKLSAADRGQLLFYDGRLSHDHWFSCHSCHSDGHSSGELADTLGDGDYGAPKRVLSLLGVADTGPWAWNGSMVKLRRSDSQIDGNIDAGRPVIGPTN